MKRDYSPESWFLDRLDRPVEAIDGSLAADSSSAAFPDDSDSALEDKKRFVADEALRRRVRLFFSASHLPALRHVRIAVEGDAVVLRGEVGSYYEKQMAAQFASRVAGVIRVVDNLEVRPYVPLHGDRRQDRTAV